MTDYTMPTAYRDPGPTITTDGTGGTDQARSDDAFVRELRSVGCKITDEAADEITRLRAECERISANWIAETRENETIRAELAASSEQVNSLLDTLNETRAERDAAERKISKMKAEQELFDEDAGERQRIMDRISKLIGLPNNQELTQVAFEKWFDRERPMLATAEANLAAAVQRAEAAERRAKEAEGVVETWERISLARTSAQVEAESALATERAAREAAERERNTWRETAASYYSAWRNVYNIALSAPAEASAGEADTLSIISELSHDDFCRLSRAFNQTADLSLGTQDCRINEWLKQRIANALV
jgi:small nuclear ribonucleoprotein (snRNP)-like protein